MFSLRYQAHLVVCGRDRAGGLHLQEEEGPNACVGVGLFSVRTLVSQWQKRDQPWLPPFLCCPQNALPYSLRLSVAWSAH